MKEILALTKRHIQCFFKDKGTFFTALITPAILLLLYVTFLYDVYYESFAASLQGIEYDENLVEGLVGGLLISSLLAVSTITVSFCANLFMVQDKVTGARQDLTIAPIKKHSLVISYYLATVANGLLVSLVACTGGCVYLACTGWYLSFTDVLALFADVLLLVLFGTALSSVICYPLTTQGQLSAVGTVVSAGYGFICGAYMPLSSYGAGLRNVLSFFPGTYGTSLLRNHALQGVYAKMTKQGIPAEAIESMRAVSDCDFEFFGHSVEIWQMYLVLIVAVILLVGGYILLNALSSRKRKNKKTKGAGMR